MSSKAIRRSKAAGDHHPAADEAYEDLMPLVSQMRKADKTYRDIAFGLNDLGHKATLVDSLRLGNKKAAQSYERPISANPFQIKTLRIHSTNPP
jgi:hypothetical protein